MADRLCGYCRNPGHQVRKCEFYAEQRNMVLSHTPMERKFFLDTMSKLGFGFGSTFRFRNWYGAHDNICTIIGHDWIEQHQYCNFKRVRYSKQVKINKTESFSRIGDSLLNADNQYGHSRIKALVVGADGISEQVVDVRLANIVRAKDIDPNTELFGGNIALVSPSFEAFPYTADDLCRRVGIHKRISGLKPERWDDICYETGIPPIGVK